MSWDNVQPGASGGGAAYFKIEDGQQKVIHVISAEPVSFSSIYFNAIKKSAIVDPAANPLKGVKGFDVRKRHAIVVYDYEDSTPKVLAGSNELFNQIKDLHTEYGGLEGVDLKIKRTGSGLKTKYNVVVAKDVMWDDSLIQGAELPDLDALHAVTPDEAVLAMANGEDPSLDFDPSKLESGPAPDVAPDEVIGDGEPELLGTGETADEQIIDDSALPTEDETPPPPPPARRPAPAAGRLPVVKPVAKAPVAKAAPARSAVAAAAQRGTDRSVMLSHLKKWQVEKQRYVKNPPSWITDLKKFGGADKTSMSQLSVEALTKFYNAVKALP